MSPLRPPETISTPRLTLRPVAEADAPAMFAGYAGDAEATRFMTFPRHRAPEETVEFARRCVRCWHDGTAYPWAIIVRDGAHFAGSIELRLAPPKADLGYILCRPHWGQGYASEAARAVVAWAIAQPRIFRVWATCHPENVRSRRVLEKAGLAREGRLENWEARPNLGEAAGASLAYALTREARA